MATAEDMKRYISKRGFSVEVDKPKDGQTFVIGLRCKTVDEVKNLLATIEEPGRFVVSVQFSDVVELVAEKSGLRSDVERIDSVLEEIMSNVQKLQETDETLKAQSEESFSGLRKKIEELCSELDMRIAKLEATPWWKKWRGK